MSESVWFKQVELGLVEELKKYEVQSSKKDNL